MSSRITVLEGYGRYGRRKRRSKRRGGRSAQARKMKACAVKWKRGRKSGSTYRSHMRSCLKK